jgi:hypothetical protein
VPPRDIPPPPDQWPPDGPTDFPDLDADTALPVVLPRTPTQAEVARMLAERFPRYGSPDVRPVQFAEVYAHLMAVAAARAEWLGQLLQDAVRREGIDALIGDVLSLTKDGEPVPVSEEIRALARMEADERSRAERLARDGIRIGIEASQVDAMRSYGKTVITAMRCLVEELGLPWTDPSVARVARRALLKARLQLGFDVRPPDEVGPPLTEEERARVLRVASG